MRESLDELFDALDLEFLLEREGVNYKTTHGSSGEQHNLQECPCCGDRRWRVYVNAETGLGNCFVCGEGLGKWKLTKLLSGLEGGEAVGFLKEILKEQGWRPKKTITAAVEVPAALHLPHSLPLPIGEQNLVYLERRGIHTELAAYFHLRYCEEGWWNFTRPDGSAGGQNFKDRVIIPVFDLDGRLVTFQGRDLTGSAERKYLFPAGLPGTGRFLLNGHNVLRARRVVMGEGFFDVAALKLAVDEDPGLRDIVPVGSFGKHLSYGDPEGNDQLGRFHQLKGQGLREVIIAWDGEREALDAACAAALRLRGLGLSVRIALLPRDKDPNEVDGAVVRQAIWKAVEVTPAQVVRWRLASPYARSRRTVSVD
ncbi:hypothetical protein [Azospirillum argentinense]|uniref:hypothetical protein n=1 Tax=Azospirillum argentinense TaxID=2970906 RepID=UPI0032DF0235